MTDAQNPSQRGKITPSPVWYEDYFDSRVLDLYRARIGARETRVAVEGILERLRLPEGARVLDVGSGWGRHAIPLARGGFRVTALDRSLEALRNGRKQAERWGVEVEWVQGDLQSLPFAPGSHFHGALSLGSSLGYFPDPEVDRRFLQALRARMASRGIFLLETLIRDGFHLYADPFELWDEHRGPPVEVERDYDPETGVNLERIRWPDGVEKQHRMQLRSAEEWAQLLDAEGFRVEGVWGGWEEEPLGPEDPEMVLVARVP
jgi:SAM-dependent methyltransferase